MTRELKVIGGSIALWLGGLFVINRILVMSGSMYPMLDATTLNPSYNPEFHKFMATWVSLGWSVLCLFIASLWWRATKNV